MHAIGHTIKKRNPAMRLCYVSAEKFTIEVINSLRFDRMITFRDRFHTVDVCWWMTFNSSPGKERTQEEFFQHLQCALRVAKANRDFVRLLAQRYQLD